MPLSLATTAYAALLAPLGYFGLPSPWSGLVAMIGFVGLAASSALYIVAANLGSKFKEEVAQYLVLLVRAAEKQPRGPGEGEVLLELIRGHRIVPVEWYPMAILVGLASLMAYSDIALSLMLLELYSALNSFFVALYMAGMERLAALVTRVLQRVASECGLSPPTVVFKRVLPDAAVALGSLSLNALPTILALSCVANTLDLVDQLRRFHVQFKVWALKSRKEARQETTAPVLS